MCSLCYGDYGEINVTVTFEVSPEALLLILCLRSMQSWKQAQDHHSLQEDTNSCVFVGMHACVHVFIDDPDDNLGIIPQESFTLFFETETLIGLGYTEKARLDRQQTIGTQLSPPAQCWGHRCMPGLPSLLSQVDGNKARGLMLAYQVLSLQLSPSLLLGFVLMGQSSSLVTPSRRSLSSCLLPADHSLHSLGLLFLLPECADR